MSQCSDLFAEVFNSGCGNVCRTCSCGKTFFNYMDEGCFDTGELESLQAKSKADPDRFIAVDHTVGTMSICGREIVMGCTCAIASNYEGFIRDNARRLAEYLRRYAAALREKAADVDVPA